MGYDLPAAIGAATAARAQGGQRVICFAGDGSLQMNIQELQTLKTIGVNVIVIVLNNRGYLSIWQTHENFFGRVIGATPESGVEFPDFTAVARAYGLRAESIASEDDLGRLDSLLETDGPLLIDLHVDPRQEFVPRIKSRVDAQGAFVTPELDDMHPFLEQTVLEQIRSEALAIRARSCSTDDSEVRTNG
ncbi:Acetolactate synthase isozyme 2 large subunit [compost metagenome]